MKGPALPVREYYLEIWTKGSRFRVREESGRHISEILADLSAVRGLGKAHRSIEEIMDVSRQTSESSSDRSEMYGDLATGSGLVFWVQPDPWSMSAAELSSVANQIFSDGPGPNLLPQGHETQLGRKAAVYGGFFEGEEDGVRFKTEITQRIASPYLLLNGSRDAANAGHYFIREIVTLEEDVVADRDLIKPRQKS
jgi:hypothetical protein